MALSALAYKDPRFDSAAYDFLSLLCNSLVAIYPPAVGNGEGEEDAWVPGTGVVKKKVDPIWRGWAAITPNKDWRARNRRQSYEDTATHVYRVQLWHIDKNLLVPAEQWGDRTKRIRLDFNQRLRVERHDTDPQLEGMAMVIRNPVTDSDWWQPTLLCDVSVNDLRGEGW